MTLPRVIVSMLTAVTDSHYCPEMPASIDETTNLLIGEMIDLMIR